MFDGSLLNLPLNLLTSLIGAFFVCATIFKKFLQPNLSYKYMAILVSLFFVLCIVMLVIFGSMVASGTGVFGFVTALGMACVVSYYMSSKMAAMICHRTIPHDVSLAVVLLFSFALCTLLFIIFLLNPVPFIR